MCALSSPARRPQQTQSRLSDKGCGATRRTWFFRLLPGAVSAVGSRVVRAGGTERLGVAKRLWAAVQGRPDGTAAMSVTDGEAGEGD
jgi:hypothetical protein